MLLSLRIRELTLPGLLTGVLLVTLLASRVEGQASSARARDSVAAGQPDGLVGTVVDAVGKPMQGIEVYLAGTSFTSRSDANGNWRIPNPPAGPRVVVAREIGYVPYVREVVIGSNRTDTISLLLRRFPRTLSAVQITARTNLATSGADIQADRMAQIRVSSGRLFTRDDIAKQRPYSLADLIIGIPGLRVQRGQNDIVITTTRSGVGIMNLEGQACELQVFLDSTPIDNEALPALDPMLWRSVEVYPQTLILTGLSMRPNKCGAVVINTLRR